MPFDLQGKTILVTGAGRGIGRELVKEIVKAGGDVYAVSVTKDNLDSLAAELPKVHPILVDLADWDATRAAVDKLGPMYGLVNCAAVIPAWQSSLEVSRETIQKALDVNLIAAVNLIQVVGKKMVEAGQGGSIVNISSINGINPMRECMPYDISKAGLDMVTKQFALELGPHNIRVNSVNPTGVLTDMIRKHWDSSEIGGKLKSHTPLGRFAELQEAVDPILFLLSDHSTMISGTINPIDGGLLSNISV